MTHLEQLLTPHHRLGTAFGATHSFDVCSEEEVWGGGLHACQGTSVEMFSSHKILSH